MSKMSNENKARVGLIVTILLMALFIIVNIAKCQINEHLGL